VPDGPAQTKKTKGFGPPKVMKMIPTEAMLVYTPIPYIVPAQLFAAHLAWVEGCSPDRPRAFHKITLTM